MMRRYFLAVGSICLLSFVAVFGAIQVTAYEPPHNDLNSGPYVDYIYFEVIANQELRINALQAGTIEMDTSLIDPSYYNVLSADPDINVYTGLRNGYGQITINCRDYPLNISALRRAFAFAFNKTKIVADAFDGLAQEHDSVVPTVSPWCSEDEFTDYYYTARDDIGNAILDAAGFDIDGGTGRRNAPDGSSFVINIEYFASAGTISSAVAQEAVDALTALHINAYSTPAEAYDLFNRLYNHGLYDMAFYTTNFYSYDVDWLGDEFWSQTANVAFRNPSNFVNSSFDDWRDQLLFGDTYEQVYEAASQMQQILHYNVPRLVVYENSYLQGYRTDKFAGHVEDRSSYITGPWTMRKLHWLNGTLGGTASVAIAEEPDSFNIFTTSSAYSAYILSNLYSSLYKYGPDGQPRPDLVESMVVETHATSTSVPEGHTRYTIDIIQNATWNDGVPITAEDVAYTFTYVQESGAYGNPHAADFSDMIVCTTVSTYRLMLEFTSDSYWLFSRFGFDYILPYHIFSSIPYSDWNSWNPVFDASDPLVTSGPFEFISFNAGNWYRIGRNELYYYPPHNPEPVIHSAEDLTYVEGTTGNYITWEVTDDNPLLYSIYKDDNLTAQVTSSWDGSDIILNVDGLTIGTYNFTLMVVDYFPNYIYSSIFVTVVPESTETTTTNTTATTTGIGGFSLDTMTLLISLGVVGTIAIIIVVVWRSKQS